MSLKRVVSPMILGHHPLACASVTKGQCVLCISDAYWMCFGCFWCCPHTTATLLLAGEAGGARGDSLGGMGVQGGGTRAAL